MLFFRYMKYHASLYDRSRFNSAEDVVILEGRNLDIDFPDIALLLGKRSANQVRMRYRLIKGKNKDQPPWTE